MGDLILIGGLVRGSLERSTRRSFLLSFSLLLSSLELIDTKVYEL